MKRFILAVVFSGIILTLNGCAIYAQPYAYPGAYYGYAPYGGYSYPPYGFYGYYGFGPRFYGGGWRGRRR